ncbi:MAG: hypothetical protein ABEI80_02565 [Haloplanus sp.]
MADDSADGETAERLPHFPTTPDTESLESEVVERDDGADSCTLYPPGARTDLPVTRWISGTGDAFVDLDDVR